MKHYWKIEAMDGFDTTFETLIPGNLTRTEVTTIIQRLACRHLTESEIISASLRKPRRTSLLEPLIGTRPASKRETVSIGHTVNYVASFCARTSLPSHLRKAVDPWWTRCTGLVKDFVEQHYGDSL